MINHFRNFLVAKTVRKSRELIICTDDEYNTILEASKEFTVESIVFALDLFQNTLVTIKGGASARIEVEMAFIKLCEPKMDESIASLLDRVSKLENAIKSGVKVQLTQTAVPAPKEEYVPKEEPKPQPKAEPTPVPMPEPEPTPVEEEPSVQEQQPVVETPPVEHKTAPPVANPNETVEFTQWGDFMDVLHRTNIPLFGVLSGSKGYVRGEFFLLDSPNPAVRDFIKLPIHSKSIKAALLEVTGVHFKLGLFKRPAEQSAPKRDPLEDLINQAQGSVNIEFK